MRGLKQNSGLILAVLTIGVNEVNPDAGIETVTDIAADEQTLA